MKRFLLPGLAGFVAISACTPAPLWTPPPDGPARRPLQAQVDEGFPAYDPNVPWPSSFADDPLIPDRAFLRALLKRRIAVIDEDGRPPADEVSAQVFPDERWSGKDARGTFSETVAYTMKMLVVAGKVGLLSKGEAKQHFDRVFGWAKRHLQAGVVKEVYDADRKQLRSVQEYPGRFDDPKGTLVNRPGCFAWRYIPRHGVIRSTDYSKDSVQAATDADLEIAGSLVTASEVFGDKSYRNEARVVSRCIAQHLIANLDTPEGKLTVLSGGTSMRNMNVGTEGPGPQGFVGFNPSYFINNDLGKLAREFDGEMDGIFTRARKSTYRLLDLSIRSLAPGSGLPPNWGQVNSRRTDPPWVTPLDWQIDPKEKLKDVAYRYDAMRVQLRLRTTRMAGLDREELKRYWLTTGRKGAECVARIVREQGFFSAEVAPNCTVPAHWDKEGACPFITSRAMFLESGNRELADLALARLMKTVHCVDPKETPPSGCTEAYFETPKWEYFPGQMAIMTALEEAEGLGRSLE